MSNAIEIKDVTMSFNLEQEKTDTLKEYLLKLAKRQLKYTEFKALDGVSFSVEKGDVEIEGKLDAFLYSDMSHAKGSGESLLGRLFK